MIITPSTGEREDVSRSLMLTQDSTTILKLPAEVLTTILEYACTQEELEVQRFRIGSPRSILVLPYSEGPFRCSLPLVCRKFRDIVLGGSLVYKCNTITVWTADDLLPFLHTITPQELDALQSFRITSNVFNTLEYVLKEQGVEVSDAFKHKKKQSLRTLELYIRPVSMKLTFGFLKHFILLTGHARNIIKYFSFENFKFNLDHAKDFLLENYEGRSSWDDLLKSAKKAETAIIDAMLRSKDSSAIETSAM